MPKIQTYRNAGTSGRFCQIRLDSGDKVLVSVAREGLAIFELGFLRRPKALILELTDGAALLGLYQKHGLNLNDDLLDAAISVVMKCVKCLWH